MGHETALTAEETALAEIISLATRGRPRAALGRASRAAAGDAPPHPAQLAAVCAVARFGASDFDTAAELGETALQLSGHGDETDPLTRVLAVSARLLSSAGSLWAGVDRRIDDHLAAELIAAAPEVAELPSAIRPYTIALLVEALFANGRIADAEHCLCILLGDDWASTPVERLTDGPALPSLPLLPVRMLFYGGRTAEAEELLLRVLELPDVRRDPLWPRLADALIALCAAARGESARARAAAQRVAIAFPRPRHYLDGSARVLAGHGLAVIGELGRAAHELKAGGGSGLRRLVIVDRALAAEALMREALLRENLRDATRWARLLLGLEAHPAVPEISLRAFAQLDLASGAADSALRRSEAALARSRLTGAMRDSAENELLRCRTLIALGRRAEAATELQRIAVSARSRGDEAGRRDAARQLRALGQRIAPERGSGWGSLNEREREVAVLAAQGFGNRAIGDAVFLSPRTVAGIIARIMVAFDVPRRAALAAAIRPEVPRPEAAPLTRRQVEVVGLITRGLTNTEIAVELGISPRTVERHVSAALAASGAGSRTALAHLSLVGVSPPASG